ncbi:MAG: response regulator [Chloroflexota bacterium]|nr:response regulator [Chloroflexota bacterium]
MVVQSAPTRVLIADDEPNVRQALGLACEQALGLSVAAEAANAAELILLLKTTHPDIVLLEWGLPGAHAADLIRQLATNGKLTIIAIGNDPGHAPEAVAAGVSAFVYKGDPPAKLLDVLQRLPAAR